MCLFCADEEQMRAKHPQGANPNSFETGLCEAPVKNPGCCCIAFFCPFCAVYSMRQRALGGDMSRYLCCQGYFSICCLKPAGNCGEKSCPHCCLALEVCCCLGISMSSTRQLVMEEQQLHPDPCDYRLMCFSNFLQILSCVCSILAIFIPDLRDAAELIRLIADLVFFIILSCMVAQVDLQLKAKAASGGPAAPGAPASLEMIR